jgi:hypothetical protein
MCRIKFEIKKPGPIAVRVVNVIGVPYYSSLNSYEVQGKYEVYFNDENLIPGLYYYRIFDMEGQEDVPIESLNGSAKVIDSGKFEIGSFSLSNLYIKQNESEINNL